MPLDLSDAPYRDIGTPLRAYIRELTADPDTVVNVVMPEMVVRGWARAPPQPARALHQTAPPVRAARDPLVRAVPALPLDERRLRRRAPAAETESQPGTRPRRARALRDRLRQRRLVDLLRARADGGHRARAHAARLHHQRPDLRRDGGDVRRGHGALPGGRRVVELRAARVQRARLVRGGVGADAQLRDHRRDLGVLRPALPVDLLGAAADEPVGHHRRDRPRRGCSSASTSSGIKEAAKLNIVLAVVDFATQLLLVAARLRPDLPPARPDARTSTSASRRPGRRSCSRSRSR